MTAMTVRYNDAPATSRSTPGSVSEMAEPPREDSRAVAVKKSATAASRLNGSIKPTSTISLAQSTGSRDWHDGQRGADHPGGVFAAERQHAEHAEHQLGEQDADQAERHPAAAELPAEILYGAPDPAIAAPRPTISTTAISAHHQVVRSARSLVHSARTTRTWVTGPATVAGAGAGLVSGDGAHRVAPAWYSMLSWVTCMKASSSEAWVGVSS